MTEQADLVPESAVELRSSVPTGGATFSRDKVEGGVDFIYAWELENEWTLYGSTGYAGGGLGEISLRPEEPASENFNVFSQSVAVGADLTDQNTLYVEWFGLYSDGLEDEFSIGFYNVGFDHYFSNNFLIDFRAGVGLSNDSDDFFAGIGGGLRY